MSRLRILHRVWPAAVGVFLVAAVAALLPSWHKGHGPRPAHDNLLVARSLALTGVPAAEDGKGSFVSTARGHALAAAGDLPATGIGNRLTYRVYAWAMEQVSAVSRRPELLAALLAGVAACLVALTGARQARGTSVESWLGGILYIVLPVTWISASSSAHVDLAMAISAGVWLLVLGGERRPGVLVLVAAGVLAGGAALARDSFVVLAGLAAIATLGRYPAEWDTAPSHRRRLLAASLVPAVAAIVFSLGGGLDSVYLDAERRGQEMSRLGHAFPDFATYERYRSLPEQERKVDPLLVDLDPRLASIYAGEGDPAPGGLLGRLVVRVRVAVGFYPRAVIAFDGFGGPLVLGLVLLGLLGGVPGRGKGRLAQLMRPLPLSLSLGAAAFLGFHACIGTSNESHLAVFAAPVALALAAGARHAAAALARACGERPGESAMLALCALVLVLHQGMASRVAMSRLYNGAGAARYGSVDAHQLAHAVAAATSQMPAGTVLVGSRGEDALAIAWTADRSALMLGPATLGRLAEAGTLAKYLRDHDVSAVVGYPAELLARPQVAAAVGDRPVVRNRRR